MIIYNLCRNVDGTGKVNWKGVAYYNRLIDYMLKRGNILYVPFLMIVVVEMYS